MYEKQVVYGELKGIKLEVEISVVPAVEPLARKTEGKRDKKSVSKTAGKRKAIKR